MWEPPPCSECCACKVGAGAIRRCCAPALQMQMQMQNRDTELAPAVLRRATECPRTLSGTGVPRSLRQPAAAECVPRDVLRAARRAAATGRDTDRGMRFRIRDAPHAARRAAKGPPLTGLSRMERSKDGKMGQRQRRHAPRGARGVRYSVSGIQ